MRRQSGRLDSASAIATSYDARGVVPPRASPANFPLWRQEETVQTQRAKIMEREDCFNSFAPGVHQKSRRKGREKIVDVEDVRRVCIQDPFNTIFLSQTPGGLARFKRGPDSVQVPRNKRSDPASRIGKRIYFSLDANIFTARVKIGVMDDQQVKNQDLCPSSWSFRHGA